jgi:hypothetical protein
VGLAPLTHVGRMTRAAVPSITTIEAFTTS